MFSDLISSNPLPVSGDATQKFLCLLCIILFVVLILQTVVAHPALFLIILLAEIVQERFPATFIILQIIRKSRSEEHTSELQSRGHLVCRLLLEKKKKKNNTVVVKQRVNEYNHV